MTVAETAPQAHVFSVDMRDTAPEHPPGVSETAAEWKAAPDPLLARPRKEPIDWDVVINDVHSRSPMMLARLAE